LYGMDESGFPPSNMGRERVIGRRGARSSYKQGGADRENVTAIVTICADGTALTPTIIFKGKNFMKNTCYSPNGWTDGELATEWIVRDFDRQTKEKAAGETRVLLLDGHSSHHTPALLQFARENNICILGYPPHCTHVLQGLDVVCFARMKEAWKDEITAHETRTGQPVKKADFAAVFGKAFLKAFTAETVSAAFRATGIYPYDPNVITEAQMQPSLATSTKASFPLPQSTPV
ncbi:DDE-domain-containing protein, partial [Athelia psychrophila]